MPNFEKPPNQHNPKGEAEMTDHKIDRSEALDALEIKLKKDISTTTPVIPEHKRQLEPVVNEDGQQIGLIEKIRRPHIRDPGKEEELWLVVDFDDVINHTTTSNADLMKELSGSSGISQDELSTIYDQSKHPNEAGKNVFRFSRFVETIKEKSERPDNIDRVLRNHNYNKYVDQAVKRALLAVKSQGPLKVRVSILTYGDPDYQKMRIDRTDIDEVVDDVIYTEGSKRLVVEGLLKSEYGASLRSIEEELSQKGIAAIRDDEPVPADRPFVVTVDDSPEHVRDYRRVMSRRGFAHVRYRHPQGKRFNKSAGESVEPVLSVGEEHKNHAAVSIYKIARGALLAKDELMQGGSEAVLTAFKSHENIDQLLQRHGVPNKEKIGGADITSEAFIREAEPKND